MKARVLTPWITDNDGNHPLLDEVLRGRMGWRWTDVTAQPEINIPTDPNLYVVEIECDAATLAAIKADSRFRVLNDSATLPTNVPDSAEFGLLVAYLGKNGVAKNAARSIIGNSPAGRTRAEIAEELRLWLATRPKAEASVRKLDMKADMNPVPMVKIWRWTIPLSSVWTWEHVIQPMVRWWRNA